MTHFYANATSIFLKKDVVMSDLTPDDFEAVRNLASFRRQAKPLVVVPFTDLPGG